MKMPVDWGKDPAGNNNPAFIAGFLDRRDLRSDRALTGFPSLRAAGIVVAYSTVEEASNETTEGMPSLPADRSMVRHAVQAYADALIDSVKRSLPDATATDSGEAASS